MKSLLQTSVVARCLATLMTGFFGLGMGACGQKGPLTLPASSASGSVSSSAANSAANSSARATPSAASAPAR